MISSVYSYYMSTYGNNRTVSKYDSHKKSELKDRYNDILHSNSKAPVYKVDLSDAAQKFAIDVKENALSLSNILEEVRDDAADDFRKNAYSSDPDVLEVKYIGEATKDDKTLSIGVKQLALPQVNTGKYLNPDGKDLKPGKYSFDVDISKVTYEFQFTVGVGETNKEVQDKLARLVNKSNIGMIAGVNADENGNTSLVITSNTTGTVDGNEKVFVISEEKEGAVAALGIDSVTSYAKDAQFTVGGDLKSSTSNEFTLGKLYDIKLKSVSDEPVIIGLKKDTEAMIDNLNNIASGFNSVIGLSKDDAKPPGSTEKLYKDFAGVVAAYKNTLSNNGLEIDENGYMSVNKSVIDMKSVDGSINNTLTELKSFSDSLQDKADNAVIDPMAYANRLIVAYKNPNHTVNIPYESSAYSGMMFNGYV